MVWCIPTERATQIRLHRYMKYVVLSASHETKRLSLECLHCTEVETVVCGDYKEAKERSSVDVGD
jgi:hypothetical protein